MSKPNNILKSQTAPNRILLLGVFGLVVIGGLLTYQIVRAEGRILPNVYVGGVNIGNRTPEQAREVLEEQLRVLNITGLEFVFEDRSVSIKANEASAAPAEQSLITYDLDAIVEEAFLAGNKDGRSGFIAANIQALFSRIDIPTGHATDEAAIREIVKEKFRDLEKNAAPASVAIKKVRRYTPSEDEDAETSVASDTYRVDVTPETIGASFDYDKAVAIALSGLTVWQGGSFQLEMTEDVPEITENKAKLMSDALVDAANKGEIAIAYDDLTWALKGTSYINALTLKTHDDGSLYVGLLDNVLSPLFNKAAAAIEQKPQGTHLVLNEEKNRALEFEGGQVGKKLDRKASIRVLDERLADKESAVVPLVVEITPAPDSDPLAEEYGIRELIGWGTSDFTGSPKNRRTNIKNGVNRLWGWMIAPGEEFGLIEKLKPFDASGGYVQELVIKGNRTIREYGGGLCQIGTTTFRAVMGAGLPVTERRNHSFRVRYYEPVGTDATLYDPAPDFKFVNDTENHVLMITKMFENKLRFEFWGTRDGRIQSRSPVTIFSQTDPPEPKLIETSSLPEGEKKCFEHGYKGAVTSFDYAITYPDGRTEEQTFRSIYKPWQEQCLIGKPGAPNIKLEWDGSLKEYPPEPGAEPIDIKVVPDGAQCSVGGCTG